MGMMEEMMDAMMGKLSKEEKLEMMSTMMEKFLAGFTAEDKQKMMERMMPKMVEGVNMMEMMPKMMMSMMGSDSGDSNMMSKMMGDDKKTGMPMMPQMMTGMMPMCLGMILPSLPKKERVSFVPRMVSILMDKGCEGMSEREKKDLKAKVLGKS
jgi:hypothetical protein